MLLYDVEEVFLYFVLKRKKVVHSQRWIRHADSKGYLGFPAVYQFSDSSKYFYMFERVFEKSSELIINKMYYTSVQLSKRKTN